MDEATSSVDTLTEALIQRMEALMKGRTSFVIAHPVHNPAGKPHSRDREWTDRRELPAELLRLGGHYYRLYTQQFRHELETQYGLAEAVGIQEKENIALAAD